MRLTGRCLVLLGRHRPGDGGSSERPTPDFKTGTFLPKDGRQVLGIPDLPIRGGTASRPNTGHVRNLGNADSLRRADDGPARKDMRGAARAALRSTDTRPHLKLNAVVFPTQPPCILSSTRRCPTRIACCRIRRKACIHRGLARRAMVPLPTTGIPAPPPLPALAALLSSPPLNPLAACEFLFCSIRIAA
jgi:hypothetical protein